MFKLLFHFFLVLSLSSSLWAQVRDSFPPIQAKQVLIARDSWAVPHIFAPTDAEVAYGLAWANAEDAFPLLQEVLMLVRGRMGRNRGKEGAAADFFVHLLNARQQVKEELAGISPEYLRYLNGYVQGLNAYARAHKKDVLDKKLFPINEEDLLAAYLISFSALSGATDQVQYIVEGKSDSFPRSLPPGSNAYAFSPSKTKDGNTYLAINPHFMIDGPLSFYEAHLQSEEGLNITGALFQGGTSVFMGTNEQLGWGHTFNYLDLVDVYELQMKSKRSKKYLFDGQYRKLKKRPVWLKVKLGFLTIPVRRMTYMSDFGPTLRAPSGKYYALRSPAFFTCRAGEQFYRMNRARNFKEFQDALRMQFLALFNIVYADKEENIYYICNGMLPERHADYDFRKIVPGTSSELLWSAETYQPIEQLPQVKNPACGYVFNMNNTPASATCSESNFPKERVSVYMDMRSGQNNRSTRFLELMQDYEGKRLSFEEFVLLKFDTRMSMNSPFIKSLKGLYALVPEQHPHIENSLRSIQNWDGDASPENKQAALFLLSMQYLFYKKGYHDPVFVFGVGDVADSIYVACIEEASAWLIKHHGSVEVELSKIMCLWRQGETLGARGFPDALCPAYGDPQDNGVFKMSFGDTYIQYTKFSRQGPEEIRSLLPLKTTEQCKDYKDELDMFNNLEFKSMSLDKKKILEEAVLRYHPEGQGRYLEK